MGTAVLTHGRRSPCAALVRSLVVMLACAACSLRTVHSQGVSPATLESRSPAEATPPPVSVSHIFMSPNVIVLPPASPGSLPLPELPGFNAPLANTNGVPHDRSRLVCVTQQPRIPSPRSIFPPASPSPSATIPPSPPNSPTSPASPAPPAIQSPSGEAPPPQNPVSSLSTDTNSPSLLVVASPASPAAAPPSPAQQLPVQSPLPTPLSPQSVISDRAAPGPFTGGSALAPQPSPPELPPLEAPALSPESGTPLLAPSEAPSLALEAASPALPPAFPPELAEAAPAPAPLEAANPNLAPASPPQLAEIAPAPAPLAAASPDLTPAFPPELAVIAPAPAPLEAAPFAAPSRAPSSASPDVGPSIAPETLELPPFAAPNLAPGLEVPGLAPAPFEAPAVAPAPVTGATLDTFASQFEQPWNGVLAGIAGVDPSWSKVMQVSSPSAMGGRRRLLQVANTAPLTISTFVASTDPNSAYRALVGSISDTSEKGLASQLRGIGLNLIPESINIQTNPPQPGAFVNPAGSAVPPPASPPAAPPAGDSNRNLILAIVLPVVLGGLLALLVVCLIIFCRRRNRGGNSSLRKPFHSRNPMYDSNVTTTSSSRGEDWEVLPVPPERRSDASPRQRSQPGNPFAEGASAFSDEDMSPPISPERPSTSRSKGDLSRSGSDYRASITLGAAAGTAGAAAVAAGLHSARSGRYDTTGSFTSVHSRGGASTNTFVTAPTTLAGHSSIQDFHDALSHAPGSIRSDSFASARSGAVRSAAGPDMFDVIARDDSFEYAPSGGEAAPSQGAQEADNPLFGGDILDTNNSLTGGGGQRNPMFDSQPGQVMRSVQAHPIRVSSDFGTVRSGSGGYSPVSDDDGARNPLYASRHSDIPDEAGEDRNPLYDSHAQMPGGAEDNPMFGTGSDLMDTRDSMGGDRNPLFDSRGNRAITPSGAAANPLFGSDILDTRDSMGGDRNPLWESSENVARQPGGPPAQRIGPPAQRSAGRVL
ncbi:hypothetical protein WJX72_006222 [[Myrmecia] bisecta]|uniref:Uncharacterized protein n=1 Tax=[Myrmecia] bisecta TaxID=41462 RepID=A0AAW1QQY9_9CHLO